MDTDLAIVCAVASAASFILGWVWRGRKAGKHARELAHYRRTFLRRSGWIIGYGTYDLESYDGGRNWYAVRRGDDGSVTVVGEAETAYPGLVAIVRGMDSLGRYAAANGPLTLSGSRAGADRAALEAAGFRVEERGNAA